MVFLTVCALVTGSLLGHAKAADKPLGPASHIYVAPIDTRAGTTDADVVRFLNRHAVPASRLALLRPLKGASKVNEVSSMNAVLIVSASPSLTFSVFMFKPTVLPDLKQAHACWTVQVGGATPKLVNGALEQLVDKWHKDHGLRTRKE